MWRKTCLFAGIGALALAWTVPARAAPAVSEVRLGLHGDKVRLVLETNEKLAFTAFEVAEPYRVVLDLPDVEWRIDPAVGRRGSGVITGFRFGPFAAGRSRLVIDLKGPAVVAAAFTIPPTPAGIKAWRLVVDLQPVTAAGLAARLARPGRPRTEAARRAALPVAPPEPRREGAPARKVIAIDPGHGGVDPGAIGRKGVYEKRITLDMANELRKALGRRGRYSVVLTREKDTFKRLRDRVAAARAAGADLFISLHADSIADPKVRGASVYTLSETASDQEAADLAARENKADLIAGVDLSGETPEVANILIDLTQRETMNHSAVFARVLIEEMRRSTKFLPKSHRFAGFAVLKAPDVPSVLVEMGYLSNAADAARLLAPDARVRLAKAIADAVDAYFARRAQASAQ